MQVCVCARKVCEEERCVQERKKGRCQNFDGGKKDEQQQQTNKQTNQQNKQTNAP